jgi:hypothetical protein
MHLRLRAEWEKGTSGELDIYEIRNRGTPDSIVHARYYRLAA